MFARIGMIKDNGFTLIELLPASMLLALLATMGLKALALDLQFRQRAEFEARLRETLSLAMERWQHRDPGTVILCDLKPGDDWGVVDYPAETWIPAEVGSGEWIAWKKRLLPDSPGNLTAVSYRSNGMHGWRDWLYAMDWQMPMEDENSDRKDLPF